MVKLCRRGASRISDVAFQRIGPRHKTDHEFDSNETRSKLQGVLTDLPRMPPSLHLQEVALIFEYHANDRRNQFITSAAGH